MDLFVLSSVTSIDSSEKYPVIAVIPVHFSCMVVQADHLNGMKGYYIYLLLFVRFSELVSKLSLTISGYVLRYL